MRNLVVVDGHWSVPVAVTHHPPPTDHRPLLTHKILGEDEADEGATASQSLAHYILAKPLIATQ